MKYTRDQIDSHFKWAANNEAPMANKWIDWCAESMFIIQEILKENERYRAALELIRDHGGKEMDESDTDGVIISCNGTWCADQANWALKGEE